MSKLPSIRAATAADQADIKKIVREAGINPFSLDWPRFLIAEEDGQVVGVGQIKQHRDGSRELASIAVIPGYRGQGIGAALIEALLQPETGQLYLFCRPGLEPYYQRFGFCKVEGNGLQPSMARMYRWGNWLLRLASPFNRRRAGFIAMKRETTAQ